MAAIAAVLVAPPSAYAVSADIVIAEVYGGGGNSGAPWRNDFIELYNRGTATVSVAGWSVQYASAAGSSWSKTNLTGSLAAGVHYLVQEGGGGSAGTLLPTPDVTGAINMSASTGKVALRTNTTLLTCSTGCATQSGVRDFVGSRVERQLVRGSRAGAGPFEHDLRRAGRRRSDRHRPERHRLHRRDADAAEQLQRGRRAAHPRHPGRRAHLAQNGQPPGAVPGVVTAVASNGFWIQDPTRTATRPPARASSSSPAPRPAAASATRSP